MTWCPTRMANILTSSKRTVEILFPLCDLLTSAYIKEDHAAYFLSPISYLDDITPSDGRSRANICHKISENAWYRWRNTFWIFWSYWRLYCHNGRHQNSITNNFLSGLKEDENGNIVYEKKEVALGLYMYFLASLVCTYFAQQHFIKVNHWMTWDSPRTKWHINKKI